MLTDSLMNGLKVGLAWLHLHPQWVAIAALLIAFLECLAIIGLLVPGTVIMTAIGAMIGAKTLDATTIIVPTIIGAILGDFLSFGIGRYYKDKLRNHWPFKKYPNLLVKGENFFYRHGGKGIFFGRFIGPLRPLLPIIAGMLNFSTWRFLTADGISAIFWVPIYLLPGILLGIASATLSHKIALKLVFYVILTLLLLWCISWLIKQLIANIFNQFHQVLDFLWHIIKDKPLCRLLYLTLQDPVYPESHLPLTLALYVILVGSLFIAILLSVIHHGVLTQWNMPLWYLLRSLHTIIVTQSLVIVTLFAKPMIQLSTAVIFFLALCWQKNWRTARHWLVVVLLCVGSVELFKHGLSIVRPTGLYHSPSGYSFPSGHATVTTAFLGFISVLVAYQLESWLPYLITTVIVLLVAFSRIYLGAHWLTDVVGGILLGITIVLLTTISYRRKATPRLNISRLFTIFIISWLSLGGSYAIWHYHRALKNYTLKTPDRVIALNQWWQQDGSSQSLYRINRTGKPIQIFNVQWAGDLNQISQQLTIHQWLLLSPTPINVILSHFNKENKISVLPFLPQLYLEHKPVLIAIKSLYRSQSLAVLVLWRTNTTFTYYHFPLWLGNVSYYPRHHQQLLISPILLPSQSALETLETDLAGSNWKEVNYTKPLPKALTRLSWNRQLLLIQPAGAL